MAFPNLDKCSCGSPRAPKVSLGSHGLGSQTGVGRFSLGNKRRGSLRGKCDMDFVSETNRKNSVINSQLQFENGTTTTTIPTTTNQNEYTKTSLDRPSQQDRIKRRQLVQQMLSSPVHNRQDGFVDRDSSTNPRTDNQIKKGSQLIENLDPSDDVFVKYYKQVRSANKTFSTFRGPPTHPQKYLRDDKSFQQNQRQLQHSKSSQNFLPAGKYLTPGDDSDDQQERTSEYTPLSFDKNYVKVSPPKLTRRQKKSAGSESDASKEATPSGQNMQSRKVRKDKAQSPDEINRKTLIGDDEAETTNSERPNSSGSDREGSSSTRNSDVFVEDGTHLPLPPPTLIFDRKNFSSNDSDDFPPPPPSATWETASDYISLENAEKRVLLSQSSDDSPPTTGEKFRYQQAKSVVKTNKQENKIGSVLPLTQQNQEHLQSNPTPAAGNQNVNNSFLEFKLTVRLEGNGPNKKMTVQHRDVGSPDNQLNDLSDLKTSFVSEKSSDSGEENQNTNLKSAIVAEICQVVTTLTKEKLAKGELNNVLQKTVNEPVCNNTNGKVFQNATYFDQTTDLKEILHDKIKSNTPLVAHRLVVKEQSNSEPNAKSKIDKDADTNLELEEFEKIKSLQKTNTAKKQTLADFVSSKITTVAQMHHSADDILKGDKQKKNDSIFSLDMKRSADAAVSSEEPLDLVTNKSNGGVQNSDSDKNGDYSPHREQLKVSKQTHMNWDDLMEEAKTLGIPLNRPSHAFTTTATSKKQNYSTPVDDVQASNLAAAEHQASTLTDNTRPVSSDSAVGTSVSSASSVAGLVLPKNNAPTLASHKAALQQVTCLSGSCCCCCGCCGYDNKSRKSHHQSHHSFHELQKCSCNKTNQQQLQSKSSAALVQPSKSEKKFSFFKDRLKLSNFFCKRFCSKSVERQTVFTSTNGCQQCSSCACNKEPLQSLQTYNGHHQSQLLRHSSEPQQQRAPLLREKSATRNGIVRHSQKGCSYRSSSTVSRDVEAESVVDENGFSTTCKDQMSCSLVSSNIDQCFSSIDGKLQDQTHTSKSNPAIRKKKPEEKSWTSPSKTSCDRSPTSNWSPNDLFKNLEKIKNHGWYWGPIGFEEAESLLANRIDGSFLVRDSSDDRYILSLSFRSQGCTHHTRIEQHKGRFSFFSHSSSHEASSVDEFIAKAMKLSSEGKSLYYLRPKSSNSLPIPVQLLYPVLRPSSPGNTSMQKKNTTRLDLK